MTMTLEAVNIARETISKSGQFDFEKGLYKSFLSITHGKIRFHFEGDWLNPVLKSVSIVDSGNDDAIRERLKTLYQSMGYIPLAYQAI